MEEKISEIIDENKEIYIEFLRELVKTDSYNPPGNELNVAKKIKDFLCEAKVKCDVYPFGNNRANLFAYLNDNFEDKVLLYNGHMDVVPPGNLQEWKYSPLTAYCDKKKIFGRGTTDMKGGLAAMVIALRILKTLDISFSGNLILNAVADEETSGELGTKWSIENVLKEKAIKSDFIVVGEPSQVNPFPKMIILGEKGRIVLKIVTNGISCHSSVPFLGKNPITMMSNIIQNIDKIKSKLISNKSIKPPLTREKILELIAPTLATDVKTQEFLDKNSILNNMVLSLSNFTFNVTMIQSGIKDNVIPDRCEAIVDIRLLPGQTPEITLQCVKEVIQDLGYNVIITSSEVPKNGNTVSLEVLSLSEASYWNDWESSKDLKLFKKTVDQIYNDNSFYFLFTASADANYFRNSNYCPQTIIFGPGLGITAHTKDEAIEIEDFLNSIKVYVLFAINFLKNGSR